VRIQLPTTIAEAYNWQQNGTDGVYLFASQKLGFAGGYENSFRTKYPALRSLSLQETELDAVAYYGPGSVYVRDQNAYWVPNGAKTDWVVNSSNPIGVGYVNQVLSNCSKAGHPGCQ